MSLQLSNPSNKTEKPKTNIIIDEEPLVEYEPLIEGETQNLNPVTQDVPYVQEQEQEPEPEQIIEEKEDAEEAEEEPQPDVKLSLDLGDVIKLSSEDDEFNDKTFIIDYIDQTKMKLIDIDDMKTTRIIQINPQGGLENGSITNIALISRSDESGYARQNGLLPGVWINIFFGGETPAILTGQITNIEEDMIEIKSFPDCDTIYINFDYQGLPEDLLIDNIQIREKPSGKSDCEPESDAQEEKEILEKEFIPETTGEREILLPEESRRESEELEQLKEFEESTGESFTTVPDVKVKNQMRQIFLEADDIVFGDEELGEIKGFVDVSEEKKRYSLEAQINSFLDIALSTIPLAERKPSVLNGIHKMLERYKQLRTEYSTFDSNGNVSGFIDKGAKWKPLVNELQEFTQQLFWLMPVVMNDRKICKIANPGSQSDEGYYYFLDESIREYKNDNNYPNRYINSTKDILNKLTPFEDPNPETTQNILYNLPVKTNINTLINNFGNFYSNAVKVQGSPVTFSTIIQNQYISQTYNTGLTHLVTSSKVGNKSINTIENLTSNDVLALRSFVMLPEPVVRFSKINLPNTYIMERSNLNMNFFKLWKTFRPRQTNVETITVNNFEEKIDFEENRFLENIQNYILELTVEGDDEYLNKTNKDRYIEFLKTIIPQTRFIFNLTKKYITGKLSLVDIVYYMEPFMIYSKDITYLLYTEISEFLNAQVSDYNKIFVYKKNAFKKFLDTQINIGKKSPLVKAIYNILDSNTELKQSVFEKYQYNPPEVSEYKNNTSTQNKKLELSNSELLKKMILKDFGDLYNISVVYKNLPYMFSTKINTLLEANKSGIEGNKKILEQTNQCNNYIIAKHYNTKEELELDNNKEIYYDKQYDTTNYSILEEYENEMLTKSPEDFLNFLIGKLKKSHKMTENGAIELAEILIEGFKKVKEGDYAILHQINDPQNKYFKRTNNTWVLDTNVNDSLFDNKKEQILSFDSETLCNLQNDCVSIIDKDNKNKCDSIPLDKSTLMNDTLKKIIDEFDKNYQQSSEEMKNNIMNRMEYCDSVFDSLDKIEMNNFLKYNTQQYKMGIHIEEDENKKEIIVSPYAKILNLILGETDYVKKQSYIITFVLKCTREPINGFGPLNVEEDPHWFYCIKSNVKLIPKSLYQIANFFVNDNANFLRNMGILIKEIGAHSDDEEYIIDKYTGYVIMNREFDVDEGYDEGFKVQSRAVMEEDLGEAFLAQSSVVEKTETQENRIISNIIYTFSTAMGINLEHQSEFIKRNVYNTFRSIMPNENAYNKVILEESKRGKDIPSYKMVYNNNLLYLTIGMILIAIQTSVPSIRTKKSFPGCSKAFMGYPIEGAGDFKALEYIGCIAYNIRSSTEPWNALARKKPEFIQKQIKEFIDKELWKLPEVIRKTEEKLAYLLVNKDIVIPEEHAIQNWTGFLPPLFNFKIKGLHSEHPFSSKALMSDMKNGSRTQREGILHLYSKAIAFSLGIQEKIQEVLNKKELLLKTANNILFMENSCCNENNKYTTIGYFINEQPDIAQYNNVVKKIQNALDDITHISKAGFMYSREDTKTRYPSTSSSTFDDETIYRAFIHYCNFLNLMPVNDDLISLCNDKPLVALKGFKIEEQIVKLKKDGRNYTNDSLLQLLQIVNRNNIVNVLMDKPQVTTIQRLRNLLERLNNMHVKTVEPKLIRLIEPTLDTFDIAITEDIIEMKDLKNYLSKSNESLREKVLDFIRKHNSMKNTTVKTINKMFDNIFDWESTREQSHKKSSSKFYDENMYNMLNFIKVYMKNMVEVFPNIIINKVSYTTDLVLDYNKKSIPALPRYWNLSNKHLSDIAGMIKKYYSRLVPYYSNEKIIYILNNIQRKSKNLLILANETPYFSSIKYNDRETYSIFDKRTSELLIQNYFFTILNDYISICDESKEEVFEEYQIVQERIDDFYTVEGVKNKMADIDDDFQNYVQQEGIQEDKKQVQKDISKLLITYLEIMNDHKNMVDLTYDNIMDRVFKTKDNEKNIHIDRLENMSKEMREVDTVMKMLKMGEVWGKGNEKGMRKYNKNTKEKEREFVKKLQEMEQKMRDSGEINDKNADAVMDEIADEINDADDIENEAYNMGDMTEDYMDGQYNPGDADNGADIDYNEYD